MNPVSQQGGAAPGAPFFRRRDGQTLIFLVMVVVIMAFVVFFNFDVHKILFIKSSARNAGDAAALAGARWQAVTFNLIGELNVAQAVAINDALIRGDDDYSEARAIADLQARLCFVGPMIGLTAAQQAAKNNGIYVNQRYTREMQHHANVVQESYHHLFIPPYAQAWDDYAEMIGTVAGQGVAALPGVQSPYVSYDHMLLQRNFYNAIATSDWCWFYHNARHLLETYGGWQTWPPLPPLAQRNLMGSEYFALNLTTCPTLDVLPDVPGNPPDAGVLQQLSRLAGHALRPAVANIPATWYCYQPSVWTTWQSLIASNIDVNARFPFASDIKKEYNYAGADAAVAIQADAPRTMFNSKNYTVTWSAAAKPLGYLEGPLTPNAYGLVLPAFHDVRLIPVDAAVSQVEENLFDFGASWLEHIVGHLPIYMQSGPAGIRELAGACGYCRQLLRWEEFSFRQIGITWLHNGGFTNCFQRGGGGGGGGGGGTRHGH